MPSRTKHEMLQERQARLGRALSLSYDNPLHIVRGTAQHLYDETGRAYLDLVNNVCHVGHCHPRVVAAARRQMETLNTNTRYLHETILDYAARLTDRFPHPLKVCFFVCSGSEANDLALRLARTHTGRQGIVTVDHAYHGNTSSLIDISPYKFNGPGGKGPGPQVHLTAIPDGYRGPHKYADPQAGPLYARAVERAVQQAPPDSIAAFICESILGCGGQVHPPDGYLREAYRHVHEAGGICIADEVQVGFGRVGSRFWGFELQEVVPDIVTLGKPIGNGHPLAAVVTTPAIANSFHNGMEYFNTFGGNPVSCAIGNAVLDVIEEEHLQQNALAVGSQMKEGLAALMARHEIIGDVRGHGLFLGIELVRDRHTLEPADTEANALVNRAREEGILLSTDGPHHNVIKIKPPLVVTTQDAERLVTTLDRILS